MNIYLMSPYTHRDLMVRHQRWVSACLYAGQLVKAGYVVFSPIAHSHGLAVTCDLEQSWDFWEHQDRAFIERWADLGVILCLDGWKESRGIAAERDLCATKNIPVFLWNPSEDLPHGLEART